MNESPTTVNVHGHQYSTTLVQPINYFGKQDSACSLFSVYRLQKTKTQRKHLRRIRTPLSKRTTKLSHFHLPIVTLSSLYCRNLFEVFFDTVVSSCLACRRLVFYSGLPCILVLDRRKMLMFIPEIVVQLYCTKN